MAMVLSLYLALSLSLYVCLRVAWQAQSSMQSLKEYLKNITVYMGYSEEEATHSGDTKKPANARKKTYQRLEDEFAELTSQPHLRPRILMTSYT